jgi:hypothetical protein
MTSFSVFDKCSRKFRTKTHSRTLHRTLTKRTTKALRKNETIASTQSTFICQKPVAEKETEIKRSKAYSE